MTPFNVTLTKGNHTVFNNSEDEQNIYSQNYAAVISKNISHDKNSQDRKKHWDGIYADKSWLEVSWYQSEPRVSLQLIQATKLDKNASIIDVGGGASVLVDYLYNQGFHHPAILDISGRALESAKKRLGPIAHDIEWIEADITEFIASRQFDLWHDRAVFHFLTEAEDRRKYVQMLKCTLKRGGHVILATFSIGGPTKCSKLNICQYDSTTLLDELGAEFKLVDETSETHITPANKEQQFTYFRFIYNGT